MTSKRASASLAIAIALSGCTVLSATLAAPTAHADTIADITATAMKDRNRYAPNCPQLTYNLVLEAVAQNVTLGRPLPTYNGETRTYQGYGAREAGALNNAYELGFGPSLTQCQFTEFGVAFLADDGLSDLGAKSRVTIVTGAPATATKPTPAAVPVAPDNSKPATPAEGHFATPTIDLDRYKAPGGNDDDKLDGFLMAGKKVKVLKPCPPSDWCALADGSFAWGEFLTND